MLQQKKIPETRQLPLIETSCPEATFESRDRRESRSFDEPLETQTPASFRNRHGAIPLAHSSRAQSSQLPYTIAPARTMTL
jgi:hypothetical protein